MQTLNRAMEGLYKSALYSTQSSNFSQTDRAIYIKTQSNNLFHIWEVSSGQRDDPIYSDHFDPCVSPEVL